MDRASLCLSMSSVMPKPRCKGPPKGAWRKTRTVLPVSTPKARSRAVNSALKCRLSMRAVWPACRLDKGVDFSGMPPFYWRWGGGPATVRLNHKGLMCIKPRLGLGAFQGVLRTTGSSPVARTTSATAAEVKKRTS